MKANYVILNLIDLINAFHYYIISYDIYIYIYIYSNNFVLLDNSLRIYHVIFTNYNVYNIIILSIIYNLKILFYNFDFKIKLLYNELNSVIKFIVNYTCVYIT